MQPPPVMIQAVPVQTQQQQQQQPSLTREEIVRQKYVANVAKGFGITITLLGGLVIVFGVASIVMECALSPGGTPIWCGVLFVVTGSILLMSSYKATQGWIVAAMVLSIVTACFAALVLMIIEIIACVVEADHYYAYEDYYNDCYDPYTYTYDPNCSSIISKRRAIDGVLIGLSFVIALLAVIFAPFTCRAVCCIMPSQGPMMYYVASGPGGAPQQVVMLPPGSQVAPGFVPSGAPGQPVPVQQLAQPVRGPLVQPMSGQPMQQVPGQPMQPMSGQPGQPMQYYPPPQPGYGGQAEALPSKQPPPAVPPQQQLQQQQQSHYPRQIQVAALPQPGAAAPPPQGAAAATQREAPSQPQPQAAAPEPMPEPDDEHYTTPSPPPSYYQSLDHSQEASGDSEQGEHMRAHLL